MLTELNLRLEHVGRCRVSYDFEAAVLLALSEGKRKIYGFDYTPPPFRQQLLTFLADRGESFESGNYVRFTVTSPETIIGLLPLVNWVHTILFILDRKPIAELGTPVLQRRWLIVPDPFAWFTDRLAEWEIVCFVGTSPYRGVDIRSERIGYSHLYTLIAPVITTYGLAVHKANLELVRKI